MKNKINNSPSKKVDRASIGKRNKRKGSDGERYYAKMFRQLGYEHCKTARLGSRMHDNAGIDLIFIPYNIQVKVGEQKAMKPHVVLEEMANKIKETFPENCPEHQLPKIIIHKKPIGAGKKSTEFHEMVHMTLEDFKKLITCQKN